MVSKANEKTKAMVARLKAMKVTVGKTKELGLELAKSGGGEEIARGPLQACCLLVKQG